MLSGALETHECAIGYRRPLRILCIAIRAHLVLRPALQLPKKLRRLSRRHRRPRRPSTAPAATLVVHQRLYAFHAPPRVPHSPVCERARTLTGTETRNATREGKKSTTKQRDRETDRRTEIEQFTERYLKKNITHAHAHAHAYVILTLTSTMMTRGCNAARLPRPPHARRRSPSPLRSARPLAPPLPFAVCTGPLCKTHPGI